MKILLIDADSKIPNLALMKLSAFYKNKGCTVDIQCLGLSYYDKNKSKLINASDYDKVFVSIVFKNNKNAVSIMGCEDVFFGGVGHNLKETIGEAESFPPDYSIYPESDCSYGFITRGCIRNCSFCVVPVKEGCIKKVADIKDIVKHKRVKFLDNNILAYRGHITILKELIDSQIRCQFNQGLDIRLVDEYNAPLLSSLNYLGEYLFAFDNIKDEKIICAALDILKKSINKDWKIKFYLYCHPDMDIKNDVIHRVEWCKRNKVLPYLMRDSSCWDSADREFYIDLAAWCNQPAFFKKLNFGQFMEKRTKNVSRREKSKQTYFT